MSFSQILFRVLVALALIGSCQSVFAIDYYWQIGANGNYGSMKAACDAWGATYVPTSTARAEFREFKHHYPSVSAPTQAECRWKVVRPSDGAEIGTHDVWVYRRGDTCTPPKVLNPPTGSCEAPEPDKCEPTIGVEVEHRHRAGEFTGAGVIAGRVDPPGSVCRDECQYAFAGSAPTKAYRFENGDARWRIPRF